MSEKLLTVMQDNAITRSSFSMSALQLDVFFNVLKQIRVETNNQHIYQINVRDVVDLERAKVTNYSALRIATKDLLSKIFEIPQANGDIIQSGLISSAVYQKGSGRILIQVSDAMKPYLVDVAKNTTRYYFELAIKLKSVYAKRFYQFIAQWRVAGSWTVSIDELKKRLQLQERYPNYFDFKKCVIEVARVELLQLADVYFIYEEIKTGKRVTDLKIIIQTKKGSPNDPTIGDEPKVIDLASELHPFEPTHLRDILIKEFCLSEW